MNRVTITLHIDLPDGVVPDVQYGAAPNMAEFRPALGMDEPPLPSAPPPDFAPPAPERPATIGSSGPPSCPDHGVAMRFKPAGVSKAGKSYSAFWACGEKNGDAWCKRTAQA